MPIEELNDLVGMFGEADRAALEQLIERNPVARARLASQDLIYRATVQGEQDAMSQLARQQASQQTAPQPIQPQQTAPQQVSSPALQLADIERLLEAKLKPVQEQVGGLSAEKLETMFNSWADKKAPAILGQATAQADALYLIRRQHEKEFGEDLNLEEFQKFVNDKTAEGFAFKSPSSAHDSFVQDKRIDARIAKGVTERLAAQQTTAVPGTTIATTSRLGTIMQANPTVKQNGDATRGDALTNAANAFRALRTVGNA